MKILMVLTSHNQLGNTGKPTGFWLEEFAAPYYVFKDAGAEVTLASPKGGQPPIDPKSDDPSNQTEATTRFKGDRAAQQALASTLNLSDVKAAGFDAVFYPGGHGPLWDLVDDRSSVRLIEEFYSAGKPVAAVCHAPAVLLKATHQGQPIVKGKRVTGFANSEEEAVGLTKVVPFLVEDELRRLGGLFEKAADWADFTIVDGRLITGQNPASSGSAARELIELLGARSIDMKLEVIVIPVSDVDRAKRFYASLGWRFDAEFAADDFRLMQFTPPGSGCSVIFGKNVTPAAPGSAQGLYLVVSDIEAAREELLRRGVAVSEPFHHAGKGHDGPDEPFLFGRRRVRGPDPARGTYRSYASFRDPDGNGWLLQEVTARAPGRIDTNGASFTSPADLAAALKRAETAHGVYEKKLGHRDEEWPAWYADYMVQEQTGKPPSA